MLSPGVAEATHHYWTMACAETYAAPCAADPLPNSCDNTDGLLPWLNSWPIYTPYGYYKNQTAWPSDWIDEAEGGNDWFVVDRSQLAVWSGHGSAGKSDGLWRMEFGNNTSGVCSAQAGGSAPQIHMKDFSGEHGTKPGYASFLIFDASCSANVAEWASVYAGCADGPGLMYHSRQGFGFNNSPGDSPSRLWAFGGMVDAGYNNKTAWLTAGGDCWGLLCDDESPVVMTKGTNFNDCVTRSNTHTIKNDGTWMSAPPCDGYYLYYLDNGAGTSGC